MEKYIPVNCDFYDELEAIATSGRRVGLVFQEDGARVETRGVIKDLFTADSVEYLKLDSGMSIRLDKLVEIDGKLPPNVC